MARHRFDNLAPEKQEAILEAAAGEFGERGFEAASINRIIKASGMSKGAVYYYFEDKADLFSTVLERVTERIMAEVGWPAVEVLGPEEFWDSLLELTHRSLEFVRREEWWIRILRHEGGAGPALEQVRELSRRWWKAIIARGQYIGMIRTDLPQDLLVETAMGADQGGDQWMMNHWEEFTPQELKEIVDGRVDLLRDMLDKQNEGWER